jgi:hypothetical protein
MSRDDDMLLERVQNVAASLIAECEARELLATHASDEYRELEPDTARAVVDARELLGLPAIDGEDDDVADGLDDLPGVFDDALEIRREGYSTEPGEWTTERVRVCVGFGGPNLYVYVEPGGIPNVNVWIDGYWGGSKVERHWVSSDAVDRVVSSELDWVLDDDFDRMHR